MKFHAIHKLQRCAITAGQSPHCLLSQSSQPAEFCSIVGLLSPSHCCSPLARVSLLISFKLFRHSTMFSLSVQASKELEPQCDDQITLHYLSFHKSLFPQALEKRSCCVSRPGRGFSTEAGLFHWTMRFFCLAVSVDAHTMGWVRAG